MGEEMNQKCDCCHKARKNLRHELIGGDFGWGAGPAWVYRCSWCRFRASYLPSCKVIGLIGVIGVVMYLCERYIK